MSETVISVENISKSYRLGTIGTGTFCGDLKRWWARRRDLPDPYSKVGETDHGNRTGETLWALKDINFSIQQGEAVGIIGRNGAGKSTLLKILSRVTAPTSGEVKVKGRIASLLEVGTGFHPELTGRENIFLNGAIMGMSRNEIQRKFDEIVDFSGVEKFIDTPVKRYSSGMYVRLAFAVAAHLEPEILIIDEVLAVGDAEFQKKCLGKMDDVSRNQGRTVLFVSHNMAAAGNLCQRGLVLSKGGLLHDGSMGESISCYLDSLRTNIDQQNLAAVPRTNPGTGEARIIGFTLRNVGADDDIIRSDLPCRAEITFKVVGDEVAVGAEFFISDDFSRLLFFQSSARNNLTLRFSKGIHKIACHTDPLWLYTGEYNISLGLSRPGVRIELLDNVLRLKVELPHRSNSVFDYKKSTGFGLFYVEHHWELV